MCASHGLVGLLVQIEDLAVLVAFKIFDGRLQVGDSVLKFVTSFQECLDPLFSLLDLLVDRIELAVHLVALALFLLVDDLLVLQFVDLLVEFAFPP